MKNRIKQIRKEANVSQEEFAVSIGLSRNMVAQVETDKAIFSERTIKDICRIYNVNEEWIKKVKPSILNRIALYSNNEKYQKNFYFPFF